jgi:hypothetical protein
VDNPLSKDFLTTKCTKRVRISVRISFFLFCLIDKSIYLRKSRLPAWKQSDLIKVFVVGAIARVAAENTEVNKYTAATFFMRLR